MFDICSCQCTLFDKCSCKKELKVPVREREFLTDQRTLKLMKIGDTDKVVSNMLKRKHIDRNLLILSKEMKEKGL